MSGEESSSIKQCHRCAAGLPAPSGDCGKRMEVHFEFSVYGLILYLAFIFGREGKCIRRSTENGARRYLRMS